MVAGKSELWRGRRRGPNFPLVLSKMKEKLVQAMVESRATGLAHDTGSNLGLLTSCHGWGFLWFSSVPACKCQDRTSDQTTNAENSLSS
jgi:hypothetical protein